MKVCCDNLIPNRKYIELLNPNFGLKKRKNIFNDRDIFDDFIEPVVEVVKSVEDADYLLMPHNYFLIKNEKGYIERFINLSKKYSKKIIIFSIGDSNESIDIPDSIVFRMSQYRSAKRQNEIIMPAYANDLLYPNQINLREKQEKPIVGFCGWGKIEGFFNNFIFWLKNTFILTGPRKQGLYFRKKVVDIVKNSSLVKSNFIVRNSYGANKETIDLDPKQSRNEYIKNIIESDFILAPKGDGNFSVRFYEVLSLGRVPILIDTDCSLPLDKDIDYSEFILKVSYKDIDKLDKIIADFYSKFSNEEWQNMQKNARIIFEKYLRIDSFLRHILTMENLLKYTSSQ